LLVLVSVVVITTTPRVKRARTEYLVPSTEG